MQFTSMHFPTFTPVSHMHCCVRLRTESFSIRRPLKHTQEFSLILSRKRQKCVCVIATPCVCLGRGSLSMAYVFKLPSAWLLHVRAAREAPQFTRSVSLKVPPSCIAYKTMVRWESAAVWWLLHIQESLALRLPLSGFGGGKNSASNNMVSFTL